MRITNHMITNGTLININRSMRFLNKVNQTIESTKKISAPSDDPIIASRALKFRTNLAETQQFIRNVQSGRSWMEVAEAALIDANENVMEQLKSEITHGANGAEEHTDRLAIITTIKELVDQWGQDMNQTYAGRYVFSGFRTDQPPILTEDDGDMSFRIEQNFLISDVEKIKSFEKFNTTEAGVTTDPAHVLKLAYKPGVRLDADGDPVVIGGYEQFAGTVKVYDSTGTFVNANVKVKHLNAPNTNNDGTNTYLNPDPDDSDYPVPIPPATVSPPQDPPIVYYIPETGELVFHPDNASDTALFDDPNTLRAEGITVTYDKTGFKKGELNPVVYFDCTDLVGNPTAVGHPQYTMDNQEIQLEFATNTYVPINSLAKDIYTDKMYTDFKRLIEFADSLKISDRDELIQSLVSPPSPAVGKSEDEAAELADKQISDEKALVNSVLQDRFNNMLGLLDKHSATSVEEHTSMGSRMLRLDLLQERLESDESAYEKLKSENEDTLLPYAIMQKFSGEAALQAALSTNAKILQMSLANYI